MSFETISLLLSWMEMGALLAILFRLSSTFNLIANTRRELRRAIYHLGEHRAAELGVRDAFTEQGRTLGPPCDGRRFTTSGTSADDLTPAPL
jgi:hypothetical protein